MKIPEEYQWVYDIFVEEFGEEYISTQEFDCGNDIAIYFKSNGVLSRTIAVRCSDKKFNTPNKLRKYIKVMRKALMV